MSLLKEANLYVYFAIQKRCNFTTLEEVFLYQVVQLPWHALFKRVNFLIMFKRITKTYSEPTPQMNSRGVFRTLSNTFKIEWFAKRLNGLF